MPAITRRQRTHQHTSLPYHRRPLSSIRSPPSLRLEEQHLSDGTIVQVTVSATGKGKHTRWIYPEGSTRTPTGAAQPKSTDTTTTTTTETTAPPAPQRGQLITPTTTLQQIPASIQNAPRKLREKHLRRIIEHVRLPAQVQAQAQAQQNQPLQKEDTIPWEEIPSSSSSSSSSSHGVKPPAAGQALGPQGTWLVDAGGKYVVRPAGKSPTLVAKNIGQTTRD